MPRIGLVLGAGGVAGHSFHAGVLSALAEHLSWDPRRADVVVGTSAGSHVGALLRAGLSAADLAARCTGEPLSPDGAAILSRIGPAEPIPPLRLGTGMAAPALLLKSALRPWSARLGTVAAAALPTGRTSLEPFAARVRWLFGASWPTAPLWLPAVRLRDGQRVVFGRDDAPRTDVGCAVAASCAVPGWFRPVEIDDERYVDGGAHSPTNADLLAGRGLDLVIVIAPMSVARRGLRRPVLDGPARVALRRRLAQEARRIRQSGTDVVAFQPDADDLATMGLNAMSTNQRCAITRQAHRSTLRRLERRDALARLEPLAA